MKELLDGISIDRLEALISGNFSFEFGQRQEELANLARIALAVKQAPMIVDEIAEQQGVDPAVTNAYVQGWHDREKQPAPDVPDECPPQLRDQIIDMCDGFVVCDSLAQSIWNACRAAMLQGKAEPVSNRDELPVPVKDHKLNSGPDADDYYVGYQSGWNECLERYQAAMTNQSEQALDMVNSPVIQDGWVMVPVEMTPEQMRAVQLKSELGADAAANLAGAYSLFSEFWRVAIAAAPQQEA